MRTKEILYICLTACVAACGCSSGGNDNGRRLLSLTCGGSRNVTDRMKKIVGRFEEQNPHIKVKLIPVQGARYYEKVEVMIAGGTPPDVMWMGTGFGPFSGKGVFLNLEPLIRQDRDFDLSEYYEKSLELYRYNGKLHGLPHGITTYALFYNKDLFDKAGVRYPDGTWTWQDMLDASVALTKDIDGDGRTDQFGLLYPDWNSLVWQNGGEILNESETKCLLDSPEAAEAIQFWADLSIKHRVVPSAVLTESLGSDIMFASGKVAMYEAGRWRVNTYRNSITDFEWDVGPLPVKKRQASRMGAEGYAIYRGTRHSQDAWKLLKHLVGREAQLIALNDTTPSLRGLEKMHPSGLPPAHIDVFVDAIEYGKKDHSVASIFEILDLLKEKFQYVLIEEKTAQEACSEAAAEVNCLLR